MDRPIPQYQPIFTLSENFEGKEIESDNSYEQDTEADDVDHDEMQHCFAGLGNYASESEGNDDESSQLWMSDMGGLNDSICEAENTASVKRHEKTERLRKQKQEFQMRRDQERRASRQHRLKVSSMTVPPQLSERKIDWEEYCLRSLPDCCWPAQLADMIATGLIDEPRERERVKLECSTCQRNWTLTASEELDDAIFDPPHAICETHKHLVCLKGHINCLPH